MSNPKISVIMSTKDTKEEYLQKSIESILNQTYKNFEFIIIDDGGKNDYKILENYNDNRIKIIKHKKSMGLTKSLNEALEISTGAYIARMDSDDISLPNRLEIQLNFMKKNNNVDVCSTFAKFIGKETKIDYDLFNTSSEKKVELFFYNRVIHSSVLIRKSFIDMYNIRYDEKFIYSQDYELWDRISKFGNIFVIPQIGLLYRTHEGQISISKVKEQNELCRIIFNRNLKLLGIEDEKITEFVFYLSGKSTIELTNGEIKKYSKDIIKANSGNNIYDKSIFKKILHYRLMIIMLRSKKYSRAVKYAILCNLPSLIIKKMIFRIKCSNI